MLADNRYVDLDFSPLENGTHILEAHLGAGKTTSTKSISHKKVLYITFRNGLISQYQEKGLISDMVAHAFKGEYLKPHEMKDQNSLAINYCSLKKLTQSNRIIWDYVIIDEPFGVWKDATLYKPDSDNWAEFKHILRTTPKVIFMGGDFPDFLIESIKKIASSRTKKLGRKVQTHKYHYPIDKDKDVLFVYGRQGIDDKNVIIKKQMDLMQEKKDFLKEEEEEEDDFFIIDSNDEYDIADELNERSKRKERNRITQNKGVLITTEVGNGVKRIAERWKNLYPDLNIQHYYSENAKDFSEDFKINLSNPDHYSDIDMLIVSPSLSTGFDINNEFDLIVGDYVDNRGMPLTPEEIYQATHRERNPKLTVIQLRLGLPPDKEPTIPEWPTTTDFKAIDKWKRACEELSFPIQKWNVTTRANDGTVAIKNEYKELYEEAIGVVKHIRSKRLNRTEELWKMYKKSGANVGDWKDVYKEMKEEERKQFDYSGIEEWKRTHLNERLTGKRGHTKESKIQLGNAIQDLGLNPHTEVLTEEQCYRYDLGNYLFNFQRRKELDDSTQSDESDSEGINLVKRITRLMIMMNKITEERYLNAQMIFYSKEDLEYLKNNRERLEALLNSYMNQSIPAFSTPKDAKILSWLEEILRKHFYLVEIKSGKPTGDLEKKAKAEVGIRNFDRWKKEYSANNDVKGYLKIYDYLFIGLTDKSLNWNDLGRNTKNYLKTFPHLIIKDNSGEYHELEKLHC